MYIEELRKLGLNLNEAKIYSILLVEGELQAGLISKKTQLNRRTVYDTIERLIDKGLIKFSISANRRLFQAVNPEIIINKIKEQEKLALNIIPRLISLYKQKTKERESSIYKGRKGIKSILNDILKYKEYFAFGSPGKFMEIMKHDYIQFQNQKKKIKIKGKVIVNESSRNKEFIRIAYGKFKFLPDSDIGPATTFIYNDSIAIIIWDIIPIATVIKSKEVNESYRKYFNSLWKKAKI